MVLKKQEFNDDEIPIIKVPAFDTPIVNIGNPQDGRLPAVSIIDCNENPAAITEGLEKALSSKFKKSAAGQRHVYTGGNVAEEITQILRSIDLKDIVIKRFHTIPITSVEDPDVPIVASEISTK